MFTQGVVGAADVFKRSGPSAAGIPHTTVFHIPGGDAGFRERMAKMSGISEIVLGAPVAAMDEENDGMRAFSGGKARVDELVWVLAVRKAQIGLGWFLAEDGFALHAKQYRTAVIATRLRRKKSSRPEDLLESGMEKVYWGGRPPECDGADCDGDDDGGL